ncbi:hypothetical protein FACS189468_2580 [Spirochaetia bacterium]|nr:hypothetical protein FACS189468_2580 [Spirochaetia bacterium]
MEEQQLLQHLLEVEAQASALVNDAQTEADRRLKEGEEQNRSRHDEQYRELIKALDEEYDGQIAAIQADYNRSLDGYRESLNHMAVYGEAFSRLTGTLLFKER